MTDHAEATEESLDMEPTWLEDGPKACWKMKVPQEYCNTSCPVTKLIPTTVWTDGPDLVIWMCNPNHKPIEPCASCPDHNYTLLLFVDTKDNSIKNIRHMTHFWGKVFALWTKDAFIIYEFFKGTIHTFSREGEFLHPIQSPWLKNKFQGEPVYLEVNAPDPKNSNALCLFIVSALDSGDPIPAHFFRIQKVGGKYTGVHCFQVPNAFNEHVTHCPVVLPKNMQKPFSHFDHNDVSKHRIFDGSTKYFLLTPGASTICSVYSFETGEEVCHLCCRNDEQGGVFEAPLDSHFFSPEMVLYKPVKGKNKKGLALAMVDLKLRSGEGPGPETGIWAWEGLKKAEATRIWSVKILDQDVISVLYSSVKHELKVVFWRRSDGYNCTRTLKAATKHIGYVNWDENLFCQLHFSDEGRYLTALTRRCAIPGGCCKSKGCYDEASNARDLTVITVFRWGVKDSPQRTMVFKTSPNTSYPDFTCNVHWTPICHNITDGTFLVASLSKDPPPVAKQNMFIDAMNDAWGHLAVKQVLPVEKFLLVKHVKAKSKPQPTPMFAVKEEKKKKPAVSLFAAMKAEMNGIQEEKKEEENHEDLEDRMIRMLEESLKKA